MVGSQPVGIFRFDLPSSRKPAQLPTLQNIPLGQSDVLLHSISMVKVMKDLSRKKENMQHYGMMASKGDVKLT